MAEARSAPEQISVNAEENSAEVRFERSLYPLDSIYGAAYIFIDRCYVLLDVVDEHYLKVELRGREPLSGEALQRLCGEFANELLTQAWRHEITERNRLTIETVTLQALAGAAGQPIRDPMADLEAFAVKDQQEVEDLEDDVFDDPLGIAIPWEEKYGKDEKETLPDEAEPPPPNSTTKPDPGEE